MTYTTKEAAAVAGCSTVRIWRMVKRGELPASRIGKRGRIRVDADVLALVVAGQSVRVT
jgi:excisionase family DNA binding protein